MPKVFILLAIFSANINIGLYVFLSLFAILKYSSSHRLKFFQSPKKQFQLGVPLIIIALNKEDKEGPKIFLAGGTVLPVHSCPESLVSTIHPSVLN